MIKDEIREDMRAKRRALSKDEVKIRSDEIRQRLFGVERVKQYVRSYLRLKNLIPLK